MQNVSDIKFLKVRWTDDYYCSYKGLDNALAELEVKITEHLKNGWVIKGEVSYIMNGSINCRCLIQTMVKYEKTKEVEVDLLKL
jgi:hypothetical protein